MVLDAMLLALLKFPALRAKLPGRSQASKMIVNVSASSTGFNLGFKDAAHPAAILMSHQFKKQVPKHVLNDLDLRNAGTISWSKYKPGSLHAVTMSYDEIRKTYHEFDDPPLYWYQKNPDFAGYVAPSLPGYSQRRSTAVLRFSYGPVPHLCWGSCLLKRVHGKWIVQRIEITDML